MGKFIQIKFVFYHQGSLAKAEVAHFLQCLGVNKILNLLAIQLLTETISLLFYNDKASLTPSLINFQLRAWSYASHDIDLLETSDDSYIVQ